jgi:hypothetical protein
MYRGTFSAEFYRSVHRLVHAEFKRHRAGEALRGNLQPFASPLGAARAIGAGAVEVVRVPWLRRRVHALSKSPAPAAAERPVPLAPQGADLG